MMKYDEPITMQDILEKIYGRSWTHNILQDLLGGVPDFVKKHQVSFLEVQLALWVVVTHGLLVNCSTDIEATATDLKSLIDNIKWEKLK